MPPAGFEPAIPADERLQTHALDRSATGIGMKVFYNPKYTDALITLIMTACSFCAHAVFFSNTPSAENYKQLRSAMTSTVQSVKVLPSKLG